MPHITAINNTIPFFPIWFVPIRYIITKTLEEKDGRETRDEDDGRVYRIASEVKCVFDNGEQGGKAQEVDLGWLGASGSIELIEVRGGRSLADISAKLEFDDFWISTTSIQQAEHEFYHTNSTNNSSSRNKRKGKSVLGSIIQAIGSTMFVSQLATFPLKFLHIAKEDDTGTSDGTDNIGKSNSNNNYYNATTTDDNQSAVEPDCDLCLFEFPPLRSVIGAVRVSRFTERSSPSS